MTYSMNWTQFSDYGDASASARMPAVDKVAQWAEASAKGTLAKLKK